jgi:hypothetical protein
LDEVIMNQKEEQEEKENLSLKLMNKMEELQSDL